MTQKDIIIIGAGASGLMTARELAKKGFNITVLEARERIGGRIHTLDTSTSAPIELGAEFIHGDQPVTMGLFKEAGLTYRSASGTMWRYNDGKLKKESFFIDHWHLFEKELKRLQEDTSIHQFLQQHFSEDKYAALRETVEQYTGGYDTADPKVASAFALRDEWLSEDESEQYRPDGGYGAMINFLADECIKHNAAIQLSKSVKEIHWQTNNVTVVTTTGETYTAPKVIITVPPSILTSDSIDQLLSFTPAIPEYIDAMKNIGYGAVIKILLQFDDPFWIEHTSKNVGFIFSKEIIPTWWTQHTADSNVLTGWLGGPAAERMKNTSNEVLLQDALQSLATIFSTDINTLKQKLVTSHIINWTAEPYTFGSYAYATVTTPAARTLLLQPINDTIYFAGEALYDGTVMGTVEAALDNGCRVAQTIIGQL